MCLVDCRITPIINLSARWGIGTHCHFSATCIPQLIEKSCGFVATQDYAKLMEGTGQLEQVETDDWAEPTTPTWRLSSESTPPRPAVLDKP